MSRHKLVQLVSDTCHPLLVIEALVLPIQLHELEHNSLGAGVDVFSNPAGGGGSVGDRGHNCLSFAICTC